jgi:ferredoxin-NADP reductase
VLLIAGGIGITPLRALLETFGGGPGDVTLLYRAAWPDDVAFHDELEKLARRRGVHLQFLVGPDVGDDNTDRLGIPALRQHVPDVAQRDVYVCGPPPMIDALRRRLRLLGVGAGHVHFERFDY